MKFGKKYSEVQEEQSSGSYLRNFKQGESTVRFLEEIGDWIAFREHYTEDGKSFPCLEDDKIHCPGCTSESEKVSKSSRKYACYVYRKDWDAVVPYRIPVTLARRMTTRSERNDGTITNRDFTVIRSGKGLDTDYDVEHDEKYAVDTQAKLRGLTPISDILEESFYEIWGSDWSPEGKRRPKAEAKPEVEDVPPSEPDEKDSSGDVTINEDDLYEMTLSELIDLANKSNIDLPDDARKSTVLSAILKASK